LVQRFEARALSRSGDKISLTLRAGSAGASIDRIYLSQANPAAGSEPFDSVDYRATMQDIAFAPPLIIPPAPLNQTNTVTIPAILYTLDHTKPLLVAIDFCATPASEIMYRDSPLAWRSRMQNDNHRYNPGKSRKRKKRIGKAIRGFQTAPRTPVSSLLKGLMSDSSGLSLADSRHFRPKRASSKGREEDFERSSSNPQ
jgi:hypothetical protein